MFTVSSRLRRLLAAACACLTVVLLGAAACGPVETFLPTPAKGVDAKCMTPVPVGSNWMTLHVESYDLEVKTGKITITIESAEEGFLSTGTLPNKSVASLPWCGLIGYKPGVKLTVGIIATLPPGAKPGNVPARIHCFIKDEKGRQIAILGGGGGFVGCTYDTATRPS